jgi:hypothetical protein
MPRQTPLIILLLCALLAPGPVPAQEADASSASGATKSSAEATAQPNPVQVRADNAKELIKRMNEEAAKDKARIKEIEALLFPYEDKIAQELFFMAPGEYTFLRRQADQARTAAQYFQAQQQIDRSSWDGVSFFFDTAYDALRAGYLWVGREQELINADIELFNDIRAKVQEEMRKRPNGQEMLKLAAERDQLLGKSRASEPLLKYFNERRLWWKSYQDYEATILSP